LDLAVKAVHRPTIFTCETQSKHKLCLTTNADGVYKDLKIQHLEILWIIWEGTNIVHKTEEHQSRTTTTQKIKTRILEVKGAYVDGFIANDLQTHSVASA